LFKISFQPIDFRSDRGLIFTRFYGHPAKRVISNSEVTNENQERRRRSIKTSKIYSTV
jgi:hypothetical protein